MLVAWWRSSNRYRFDRHAVYRHAHATGLFAIRDRNLRRALGLIIHRAETARNITGDTVIRAVRTLAHINDAGEWVNPPTHVIVSSGAALQANGPVPSPTELLDTPGRVKNELKP